MNSKLAGMISILAFLAMSGCASMNADECAISDWRMIGFEDGSQGYNSDRIGTHRKACAKHGVAPDFDAYQAGRNEGLQQFCQPSRGYNLGVGGGRYSGVCSGDLEADFVDAFNTGHRLYTLRSNVNSVNYQISARRAELDRAEKRAVEAGLDLVASETTTENRILLLAELKDLSERTGQLEAEIVELTEDRVIYEQQLAAYEQTIANANY